MKYRLPFALPLISVLLGTLLSGLSPSLAASRSEPGRGLLEALDCTAEEDVATCAPLGRRERSRIALRLPAARERSTAPPPPEPTSLVIIDAGGPGIDVAPALRAGYAAFPAAWDGSYVAVLQEPWRDGTMSQACRGAVNGFFTNLRRGKPVETSAQKLARICELDRRGWREEEYASTLDALLEAAPGRTLLVGASFGAYRLRAALDDLSVSPETRPAVIFDSPPDALIDGTVFLEQRARNLEALLETTFQGACPRHKCSSTDRTRRLAPLFASPAWSREEGLLGLLAAMMHPEPNGSWLWASLEEEPAASFQRHFRRLIDAALRRESFDFYAESWVGYFAELCPRLKAWPEPNGSGAPGLGPELEDLLARQHSPCRFFTASPWTLEPLDGWNAYAVRRSSDLVSMAPSAQDRSPDFGEPRLLEEESGHTPLRRTEPLDRLLRPLPMRSNP